MNSPLKQRLLRIRWWINHVNRRQMLRWLYRVTRPASYPYITGDGFRRLARHVYDETGQRISPRKVRDGDVVFVSTDCIGQFFGDVAPRISARYRLITHNSIVAVDEELVARMPLNVLTWFAKNNTFTHEKVVPIPLGLENLYYYNVGVPSDYAELRAYSGSRKDRILSGFTIATNPRERQPVFEIACAAPCVDRLPGRLEQQHYLKTLVSYKFLLSPPGNGLDANRTWEAMYLGVVPIVKPSVAMTYFEHLGLPLWIVGRWDDLLSITEPDLQRKYEELQAGFDCPALFMNYWRKLILNSDGSWTRNPPVDPVNRQAIHDRYAAG